MQMVREYINNKAKGGKQNVIKRIFLKDREICERKLESKPECYAMSQYITTGELGRLTNGIDRLTIENYVDAFKNAYEI